MARIRTVKLKETKNACPPGAVIIDADYTIVRDKKPKRRKRSWLVTFALIVLAVAAGGLMGFAIPAAFAALNGISN